MTSPAVDLLLQGQGLAPNATLATGAAANAIPAGLAAPPDPAAFLRTLSGALAAPQGEEAGLADSPASRLVATLEREPSPRLGLPGFAENLHPALNQIVASLAGAQDRALRLAEGAAPDATHAERAVGIPQTVAGLALAKAEAAAASPAFPPPPLTASPTPVVAAHTPDAALPPLPAPPVDVLRALANPPGSVALAERPTPPGSVALAERPTPPLADPIRAGAAPALDAARSLSPPEPAAAPQPASEADVAGRAASLALAGEARSERPLRALAPSRSALDSTLQVRPASASPSPNANPSEPLDRALRAPAVAEPAAGLSSIAAAQLAPKPEPIGKPAVAREPRRGLRLEGARNGFVADAQAATRAPALAGNSATLDARSHPFGPVAEAAQAPLTPQQASPDPRGALAPELRGLGPEGSGLAVNTTDAASLDPASRAPVSASRVPEALAAHVERLTQGNGGTARIRLHPQSLGELHLQIRVRGQAVDVTVIAREVAAQALVAGGRDQLADALSARDLRMENFDVHGGERDAGEGPNRDARAGAERDGRAGSGAADADDARGSHGDRHAPFVAAPVVATNDETNAPDGRVHFVI